MKHEERGVIRIGDKTDHGGEVISASSGTVVMGKLAALADDMTICPRCKGTFAIKPDGQGAKHAGRSYAYHNDVTECGAKLLSSLDGPAARGTATTASHVGRSQGLPGSHDEHFIIRDPHGSPVANLRYKIKSAGREIAGTTDALGRTALFISDKVEALELFHVEEMFANGVGVN